MKWEKKGLIYCPQGIHGWDVKGFLTPNPFLLNDDVIRVYGSIRDNNGAGRIGYVDVDAKDPKNIIAISEKPVLDLGEKGAFDDNGVILGDVIRVDNKVYMYYVGFQLVHKVKFLAFSGLAISVDNGQTFNRYSKCPIMDRADNALYIRAIHSVLKEGNTFKIWYSVGNDWQVINNVLYPKYDIRYTESDDGINFNDNVGVSCILPNEQEYRIGRPRVRKIDHGYEMRYTSDTYEKEYKAGYAESSDGIHWERMDHKSALQPSQSGWDSEMACYPVIIKAQNKTYMFYDGNGMGETGFGYAELLENK